MRRYNHHRSPGKLHGAIRGVTAALALCLLTSTAIGSVSINTEMAIASPTHDNTYTATIDLSGVSSTGSGTGYTISGGALYTYDPRFLETAPTGVLSFNADATNQVYHIIQTGVPNAGVASSKGKKYGTSMFADIRFAKGATNVTVVITDIDMIGTIHLDNTSVNLLLDQTNYLRGRISVPVDTEITISSLNGNNTTDALMMPILEKADGTKNLVNSNARIGGNGGGTSGDGSAAGTITINGGRIDIDDYSTGAVIGGGGGGTDGAPSSGSGGNGGTITINGGSVSVIQHGGTLTGTGIGVGGAGIGGGGGNGVNGGHGGMILITGGDVKVRQYTRGAGIGGGTYGTPGSITITGGNIDSEVIRISDTPGYGEGAAIGGGCGTNSDNSAGQITISGGFVRAVSYTSGIGTVHGNSKPIPITITGGTVIAKGDLGAGIGYWLDSNKAVITITGATVIAESLNGVGIGGVHDLTAFHLDADANIKAYAGGTKPAINVSNNTGDGFYVNASLNKAIATTSTLYVYQQGQDTEIVKELTLPANYEHFGYSSDLTSSRTDNILTFNGDTYLGTIVRVADDSPEIFSVIFQNGYDLFGASDGSLPVKLQGSAEIVYVVTENYVGISGVPVRSTTKQLIKSGNGYSKTIPEVAGYITLGYLIGDTFTGAFTASATITLTVNDNTCVYFVYSANDRYVVKRDNDDSIIGVYHWLAEAVDASGEYLTQGSYTILATEDDPDMAMASFDYHQPLDSSYVNQAVIIPNNKVITLASVSGGTRTITMASPQRHFIVLGDLTITDIVLVGNSSGGGIDVGDSDNRESKLTINTGAVIKYSSATMGGAVHADYGTVCMTGGQISDNQATDGGGIYLTADATLTISDGQINNNQAIGNGGGIWTADYANLEIATAFFAGNTASTVIDIQKPWNQVIAAWPKIISDSHSDCVTFVPGHPINNQDINVIIHTVSVHFVDELNEPLVEIDPNPKTHPVVSGFSFGITDTVTDSYGFAFIDWRIDSGALMGNTQVQLARVTADADIYLIFSELTTLTVYKTVAGEYGNETKDFYFMVHFFADATATMALTEFHDGSIEFRLKHGESKVIVDVPVNCYFQIVEVADRNYEASFEDGLQPGVSVKNHDTGILAMTHDREIHFTNTRIDIVVTGINLGSAASIGITALGLSSLAVALAIALRKAMIANRPKTKESI